MNENEVETKQQRRQKRKEKKREKMPQHGKGLARIYKNAVTKRAPRKGVEEGLRPS